MKKRFGEITKDNKELSLPKLNPPENRESPLPKLRQTAAYVSSAREAQAERQLLNLQDY